MGNYALFQWQSVEGEDFHNGGWHDLVGIYDTLETAKSHISKDGTYHHYDWHIVDLMCRKIVAEG